MKNKESVKRRGKKAGFIPNLLLAIVLAAIVVVFINI